MESSAAGKPSAGYFEDWSEEAAAEAEQAAQAVEAAAAAAAEADKAARAREVEKDTLRKETEARLASTKRTRQGRYT